MGRVHADPLPSLPLCTCLCVSPSTRLQRCGVHGAVDTSVGCEERERSFVWKRNKNQVSARARRVSLHVHARCTSGLRWHAVAQGNLISIVRTARSTPIVPEGQRSTTTHSAKQSYTIRYSRAQCRIQALQLPLLLSVREAQLEATSFTVTATDPRIQL